MALRWPSKDPDDVLDYQIDWLGDANDPGPLYGLGDAISDSAWTVPAGISKESDTFDDGSVTIWLSGGTAGETYEFLNRITTDDGRVLDQTVKIKVKDH
jgi:hypothetical protein